MVSFLQCLQLKRIASAAAIIVSLLASVLLFAAPASAATAPNRASSRPASQSRVPMIVRGFDQAVAEEHGYHIVTINGVVASVKDGSVKPVNRLTGDCGASWIYLDAAGHLEYYYVTGFDSLPLPAVFFGWSVDVYGPNGYDQSWTFGGGIFSTAWSSGNIWSYVDDEGFYDAQVNGDGSWVILVDGSICWSLGPASRAFVS